MLEIRTTNGETLIHDDQQPDAMVITGYDGSRVMVHGGAWGNHKYIRKEGNRYIYPEDLQKAVNTGRKVAQEVGNYIKDKSTRAKYATKDAIRKGSEQASKTVKKANDESKIYVDAAKNMASDYKKKAKDAWENGGKETAKKIGKTVIKNSKIGGLVSSAPEVFGNKTSENAPSRMRQGGSSNKKKKSSLTLGGASQVTKPVTDESTERSMPEKKKRPKSRQKKVVEGGKEIKVDKTRSTKDKQILNAAGKVKPSSIDDRKSLLQTMSYYKDYSDYDEYFHPTGTQKKRKKRSQ